MTTLPPLENWDDTRLTLHKAAQVLGAYRKSVVEPEPNHLHLALRPAPEGLTTKPQPDGELVLDIATMQIIHRPPESAQMTVSLEGHSQSSLVDALGLDLPDMDDDTPFTYDPAHAKEYQVALGASAGNDG